VVEMVDFLGVGKKFINFKNKKNFIPLKNQPFQPHK
jgi:hypothetical protein